MWQCSLTRWWTEWIGSSWQLPSQILEVEEVPGFKRTLWPDDGGSVAVATLRSKLDRSQTRLGQQRSNRCVFSPQAVVKS